jgi:hypothetical protein
MMAAPSKAAVRRWRKMFDMAFVPSARHNSSISGNDRCRKHWLLAAGVYRVFTGSIFRMYSLRVAIA